MMLAKRFASTSCLSKGRAQLWWTQCRPEQRGCRLDEGIVAVSPTTVYRVLKTAGRLDDKRPGRCSFSPIGAADSSGCCGKEAA